MLPLTINCSSGVPVIAPRMWGMGSLCSCFDRLGAPSFGTNDTFPCLNPPLFRPSEFTQAWVQGTSGQQGKGSLYILLFA